MTKYAGLVCAQAHRQELIQDLYKTWHDPVRGVVSGGMIRYGTSFFKLDWSNLSCLFVVHFLGQRFMSVFIHFLAGISLFLLGGQRGRSH